MTKEEFHQRFVLGAEQAIKRAANKVVQDAIDHNEAIPIWENGKVVYKIPTPISTDSLETVNPSNDTAQ